MKKIGLVSLVIAAIAKSSYGFKFSILAVASVVATGQTAVALSGTAGYLNNDTNPASGAVTAWGGTGRVAFDYSARSVALDFETPQLIRSVKLRDSNETTRNTNTSYTVWYSNDNTTYTQITSWQFGSEEIDGRLVHTLRGFNITARYLKIHTTFTDTAYSFVLNNLQEDLRASSTVIGLLSNDTNPATGTVTAWGGTGNVAADCLRRSIALDFGTSQTIRSVKLRDSNTSTRAGSGDYTLWYSDDNTNYTETTGWQLCEEEMDGRLIHTLTGFEVTARYLKVNSGYTDSSYTFLLLGLQDNVWSFRNAAPDFGVTLHSDGDRLFPYGNLAGPAYGVTAAEATNTVVTEVDQIATAGFSTLKMGMGTDVLNWDSLLGSSRDWRLDDPTWALTTNEWASYAVTRGQAWTARNLFNAGLDPIRVAAEQARDRGMHFFLSYRIADTHFTGNPEGYPLTEKFYLDSEASTNSADWVTIDHSGSSPVPGYQQFDELMNFDSAAVRSNRLNVICEALERYKDVIDGFEIEFNRSVALFPLNEGAAKTNIVTEFLQDIRDYMDDLESETNRPYYFGIRVPWNQAVCAEQGLDVDGQIRARRVDYVVPSNIMTVPNDMDIRSWVAAGQPNNPWDEGVAVYAGMPARKPNGWTFPKAYTVSSNYTVGVTAENEQLVGAACAFYDMGADGIELYNFAGLVASSSGRTRLGWLATNLVKGADTSMLNKILAIAPVHAKPYEGRLEYIKKLPAEFHDDGTVWANSWDGAMAQQTNNQHVSELFVTGREDMGAGEEWFLRLGIRSLSGQPLVLTNLSLRVSIDGSELWNGLVYNNSPASLVAPGDPWNPEAWPAPTYYITIPITNTFSMKDSDLNGIIIEQNSSCGFGLQEIQVGIFP